MNSSISLMFLLYAFLAFFILSSSSLRQDSGKAGGGGKYLKKIPGCDAKALGKADQTLQRLVATGSEGRKFPENFKQLPAYCHESEALVKELTSFVTKCYHPEIRNMAKIMIYSVRNLIKQFCRRRSKKVTKMLSITPCINRKVTNNTCMQRFVDQAATFQYLSNDKLKVPYTCCAYAQAMECVETGLEKIPCARAQLPIVLDFIKGFFGNMANTACGSYTESTTKCEELGEPPKVTVKKAKKYNTFMFVLIDLMESMEGFNLP